MSSDNGVTFELSSIDTALLISGQPYQRLVREGRLRELTRDWEPGLLDPLVVSYRDGNFYLVDGQHRVIIQRRMHGGDFNAPCKLYHGLTYEAEAELCWKLDKAREQLSAAQSANALIEAGSDPEIMEIHRLLLSNGFRWALDKRTPGDYEVTVVQAVISAYRLLGSAAFDRMLYLMDSAWKGAPSSLRAGFISGMALFLKTYETELVNRTAIKRLTNIDPEEVVRRGKTDFSTNRAALRYARVLRQKYNSQPGGRKLPYRFME